MTEPRRFRLVDAILLIVVIVGAGACRAGYLNQYADNARNAGPFRVQDDRSGDLTALEKNLKAGNGFYFQPPLATKEEPTAFVAPAYPMMLSLLDRFVDDWNAKARWLQAGLGTLAAGLYFLIGRRVFRNLFVGAWQGLSVPSILSGLSTRRRSTTEC